MDLTEKQSNIFKELNRLLLGIRSDINLETSVEKEIVFSIKNEDRMTIMVLDEDGDIIINVCPFNGKPKTIWKSFGETPLNDIVEIFLNE